MSCIKSRKHRITQLITIAAGTLPLASTAMAQEQAVHLPTIEVQVDNGNYKADKVSSNKFTQPLLNTTQTVSIVKEEVLKDQNVTTLTEALNNVPGVGVFNIGENGRMNTGDAISIRGLDVANSIFVDGIRDLGNITRDTFNTEQVEVFKGAAGTDNGRTAATGAINMSSKKAKLEDINAATLGFGSDNYYRATADLNKKLGESTALRLNAVGQNSDGIGRDGVENKKWGIAASLGLGLGSDTRTYLNYLHIEQNNIPDAGVSVVGRDGYNAYNNATLATLPAIANYLNSHSVDPSTFYGTYSDFDDSTADMATILVEHDISDKTRLSSNTRWGAMSHQYLTTTPGTSVCTTINCVTAANGGIAITNAYDPTTLQTNRGNNSGDTKNQILANQTNLATTFNTGSIEHNLSMGLEFAFEDMNSYGLNVLGESVGPTYLYNPNPNVHHYLARNGSNTDASIDTYSAYIFDTLKISPKFQINGGIRLDNYHLKSTSVSTTAAPTVVKDSGNLFNWKLGVLFKPTQNGSLYANYSLQQQAPGTITGGDGIGNANALAPTATGTANNINMDPQEIHNYELGTKWEFFDSGLLLTGALFYTEITNGIENIGTSALPIYVQNGKKTIKGIELSAVGNITENWQVIAGYTNQDAKIHNLALATDQKSADGSDVAPFTPTDAATLWSTYKINGWSIGGGARYVGEMKKSNDGNKTGPAIVPDYWTANAMLGYQLTQNIGVQLNVNNIFDKDYIASINRGGNRYYPGTERNYRLAFNFNF